MPNIVFWGTYDLSKPRTRILLAGLAEAGASVTQIHADIWPQHADKSQLNILTMVKALIYAIFFYPILLTRLLRTPRDAVVVVSYLGALDVLAVWPFAKIRGQRLVWDMFLSLYDTVVNDRRMLSKNNPAAIALRLVEWLAARAADQVLLDTRAHADYIARLFSLPDGKTDAVPVGAELDQFPRLDPPAASDGPTRVLFYGQLIPLHGVETILEAAVSERGQQFEWHLIGKGQEQSKIEAALSRADATHIKWDDWVPYDALIDAIRDADVCLGIFGASDKAASVVPNKVYQSLFAGRSVISRDSPAMAESFADVEGLKLVPHSDPESLLDAIEQLRNDGFPVMPLEQLNMARPDEIGHRFLRVVTDDVRTVR